MSFCPRPPKTTRTAFGPPATKTVNAPAPRDETCGPSSSEVITGGGSSSETTVFVPGPPGPQGPRGWGFKWEGEFALNKQYRAQSDTEFASVVEYMGQTWIAVADNISTTEENPEFEPGVAPEWELVAAKGEGGALVGEDKSFFDSLKDDVFDWFKNASLGEILLAGAAAVGVVWAGTKIVEALLPDADGSGDGQADTRYNGSPGLVTTGIQQPGLVETLESLCEFAGIPYDTSALVDEPISFAGANTTSVRSIIDQLSLAYQFEVVDTSGVYKFVPRAATPVKTLALDDIGFGSSDIAPPPFVTKRVQGIDLPRSVTLTYFSEDTDYNQFTQTSNLVTYAEGQDVKLEAPVVLSHQKAKQISELALIQSHLERTSFSFNTTYKHIDLEPGDVILHPTIGAARITKLSEDQEGILKFEAVDAGAAEGVDGSNLVVEVPPASNNVPLSLGYSQGFFIDPGNINDADTGVRMLVAVHGFGRAGWPGAQIFVSENNGASYEQVGTAFQEATIGLVATATPAASYYTFDNTTTITVQVKTNSLLSVSELDVLNGRNWALVGQEIIGFKNAVLVGERTYQLSGLLRGRQGTEQFIGTHVANELFVLLDSAIVRLDWQPVDRNSVKKYKVVTIGSSLDRVDAEDVFMVSNNLRMWTVHSAKITKVGADFQLSWKERVRYNNGLRDGAEIEHDPDWAGYGIAIMSSDESSIVNTYTTTSETFTYTSAMQTADFGAPQLGLKTQVVQLSRTGAPGYPTRVNT